MSFLLFSPGFHNDRIARVADRLDSDPFELDIFHSEKQDPSRAIFELLDIELIENKREDLHPLEEAKGFRQILDAGGSVDEIVARIGKHR